MVDKTKWNLYWNLEGNEYVRANLVYTPYVSPDNKTICMSFNRDIAYHKHSHENVLWTDELLTERFNKEIAFHTAASLVMPTLNMLDIDVAAREIYFEWHGDDFLMQGHNAGGYENVLPDWKEQWIDRIETMWNHDIYKISLHPNSWTAYNGDLIPINWFFCYNAGDPPVTLRSLLIQISAGRQGKLNVDLDKPFTPKDLQQVAFNSFRNNYPQELIDNVIQRSTIH